MIRCDVTANKFSFHRKKLTNKVQEMEEALQAAELKGTNLEKVKNRMNGELEDLMIDLEKVIYFVL